MSPTSAGITASLSYASQNDVSLVGVLAVILYAHSMLGSSSGHNLSIGLRVDEGGVMVLDPQL